MFPTTTIDHDDILLATLDDDLFISDAIDGIVTKPSLRTLGNGAQQATAGDDARLSDDRTATGLRTATTVVATAAAAAPSAGQVLKATGDSAATWQTLSIPTLPTMVDNEVPAGDMDHINKDYTLAHVPTEGSEHVFKNGLRMSPVVDYTIVTDTITLVKAPKATDHLLVDYRY